MPNTLSGNQPDELDSYLTSNIVLDDYKINNEHGVEFDLLKFWKVEQDISKIGNVSPVYFSNSSKFYR